MLILAKRKLSQSHQEIAVVEWDFIDRLEVFDTAVVVDGKEYANLAEAPDLGSWVATSTDANRRSYEGLSADIAKLPKYDDLGTGSSALCVDNGDFYKYEATTKTWYKL